MKVVMKKSDCPRVVGRKRGIVSEYLPWIIIALAVLAIVFIAVFVQKGEGISLIEKIKGLFGG